MQYFINIEWFLPEIIFIISIITLLTYAIINAHYNGIINYKNYINNLSILILFLVLILLINNKQLIENDVIVSGGLLMLNNFNLTIKIIITLSGIVILSLNHPFKNYEFSILLLIAILGVYILVSANDLIILYLGLELFSLTSYILATFQRNAEFSTEAGLKYFILGAVSSGIYLLGCVILYSTTGLTNYIELENFILYDHQNNIGAILILLSLFFKLAAAPLHMWAPDVYEGSPTIVTAFFAIVPKLGIFGSILILITGPFLGLIINIQELIIISAILSLLIGSLGALNQSKIKRLFAYSAIGHIGFLFIGLATGTLNGFIATLLYFIIYIIMSIVTFSILLNIYPKTSNYLNQLIGLSRSKKLLGLTFSLCLLSIAGVPPLAGFISKYYILSAAINSHLWLLTGIAIISSIISAYYYLQIIKIMYFKDNIYFNYKLYIDLISPSWKPLTLNTSLILGIGFYLILTILIYPTPLLNIINDTLISTLI